MSALLLCERHKERSSFEGADSTMQSIQRLLEVRVLPGAGLISIS